jgi:hypothetical protein
MGDVEPVRQCPPAPLAGAESADRGADIGMAERVNAPDLVGNARRRVAQNKARDALGMFGGKQQAALGLRSRRSVGAKPEGAARGFADPMHAFERQGVEHREDLARDHLRRDRHSGRQRVRIAASLYFLSEGAARHRRCSAISGRQLKRTGTIVAPRPVEVYPAMPR